MKFRFALSSLRPFTILPFYLFTFLPFYLFPQNNLNFTANGVNFEMVFVKGGSFEMGCSDKIGACNPDEKPAHNVSLSDFYMGEFEVSQQLWHAVMSTTLRKQYSYTIGELVRGLDFSADEIAKVWRPNREGDNYPMYYVNYNDCVEFCSRLTSLLADQLPANYKFSLPTEAQWEFAARGANQLSIFDMSGNLREWCSDWYKENYYSSSPTAHPKGPNRGRHRVLRGSNWNYNDGECRLTTRFRSNPDTRTENFGFRLSITIPKKVQQITKYNKTFSKPKDIFFKVNDVRFKMIYVKGSSFLMGCTSEQSDCFENEKPVHNVTLTDYYLGEFEVTQQLWDEVMGTNIRQLCMLIKPNLVLYGEGDLYPMYYVNYEDCEKFCDSINQLLSKYLPEGYKFVLPNEPQWEFAARGGQRSRDGARTVPTLYSGSNNIYKVAWFDGNCGMQKSNDQISKYLGSDENAHNLSGRTSKVGLKNKNELGFYDMSGNLWEWCSDWFGSYEYQLNQEIDSLASFSSSHRVMRGGSWRSIEQGCRVSCRSANTPNDRSGNVGFRVALVRE